MDLRDEREEANSFTRGQARSETQHHQVASTSKVGESSFPIPTSARSSGSQISSIGRKPSRRVVTGILQYPPGAVSTIVPGLGPDGHPDASKPGPSTKRKKRDRHAAALESIRSFLKGRSSYDGLPVSFRLVVLDTKLVVKPALDVMWQAGVVSAPLWQSTAESSSITSAAASVEVSSAATAVDNLAQSNVMPHASMSDLPSAPASECANISSASASVNALSLPTTASLRQNSPGTSPSPSVILSESAQGPTSVASARAAAAGAPPPGKAGFAGMLTVNDIIHLIQYYYHHSSYDNAAQDVERFRLEMLRDIEQALNVPQPPLLSIEPMKPLYEACELLIKTHARRLPLLDYDEQTGMETVISVLTQYRVLKFIAMNCRETAGLHRTIRALGIGTFTKSARGVGSAHLSALVSQESSRPSSSAARASSTNPSQAPASRRSSDQSQTQSQSSKFSSAQLLSETQSAYAFSSTAPRDADLTTPTGTTEKNEKELDFTVNVPSASGIASASTFAQQYEPVATATLDTTVFDVVHIFSERGISAVPILDNDGYVVDLYEAVDVIDLVRTGAYQSLDLTIRQALARRPKDFGGVMTCGPDDSLASIFSLLRHRRVHRLIILEPDPFTAGITSLAASLRKEEQEQLRRDEEATTTATRQKSNTPAASAPLIGEAPRKRGRGRLIGILCLSDILKYVIGAPANASRSAEADISASTSANQRGSHSHSGTSGRAVSGIYSGAASSKVRVGSVSGDSSNGGGNVAGSEAESLDVGLLGNLPSTFNDEETLGETAPSPSSSDKLTQQTQPQQTGAGQSVDVPSTIDENPSKEEVEEARQS